MRFDIGIAAGELLERLDDAGDPFGINVAQRWGGMKNGVSWNTVYTLAFKIPFHLEFVLPFIDLIDNASRVSGYPWPARKSLSGLRDKLRLGLGFPVDPENEEAIIWGYVLEHFGEVDAWLVYADWLEEHQPNGYRHDLIRGLMQKKPIKCKYGIPLLARVRGQGKHWEAIHENS